MQRVKEVASLEDTIAEKQVVLAQLDEKTIVKQSELDKYAAKMDKAQDKFEAIKVKEKFIANNAWQYDDDPEFQLPNPKSLMSAKTYHDKIAVPLVSKLKDAIRSILLQFFEKTRELKTALDRANGQAQRLSRQVEKLSADNERLHVLEKDYGRLRRGLGDHGAEQIISANKEKEIAEKKKVVKRDYVR